MNVIPMGVLLKNKTISHKMRIIAQPGDVDVIAVPPYNEMMQLCSCNGNVHKKAIQYTHAKGH